MINHKLRNNLLLIIAGLLAGFFSLADCQSQELSDKPKNPTEQEELFLGGDKDEHSCIGTAGYIWCEERQKCVRPWEENCYQLDPDQIKFLIAVKYGLKEITALALTFEQKSELHARGKYKMPREEESGEKTFLAAKHDGIWIIVYDQQENFDCDTLKPYNFPSEMIPDICR